MLLLRFEAAFAFPGPPTDEVKLHDYGDSKTISNLELIQGSRNPNGRPCGCPLGYHLDE